MENKGSRVGAQSLRWECPGWWTCECRGRLRVTTVAAHAWSAWGKEKAAPCTWGFAAPDIGLRIGPAVCVVSDRLPKIRGCRRGKTPSEMNLHLTGHFSLSTSTIYQRACLWQVCVILKQVLFVVSVYTLKQGTGCLKKHSDLSIHLCFLARGGFPQEVGQTCSLPRNREMGVRRLN